MNNKIIITIGISGSGKSTFAKELCKKDNSYRRINRDDLRLQLVGTLNKYYKRKDLNILEKEINDLQNQQILYFLNKKLNIIIDNTHLSEKYIDDIINNYSHLADIEFKIFECDLKIAQNRIIRRDFEDLYFDDINSDDEFVDLSNKIEVNYIINQYNNFQNIKKVFINNQVIPLQSFFISQDITLPKCCIVDLDGTLSLFDRNVKNPYNRDFENDLPNLALKTILENYKDKIFIFSGRDSKYLKQTVQFLKQFDFKYELIMRNSFDNRKDYIIKQEFFKNIIKNQYYCEFAIDDRLSVIRNCWNKLGITVLNVNQNLEEF